MALPNTIEIKFKGNSKELTDAIKSLDRATKSLINSQAKLIDKEVQHKVSQSSNRKALKRMFIELRSVDSGFKKAGVSNNLFTSALKGNKIALEQVRMQVKKHTSDLKRNKTSLLGTTHDTRILGGSFAVLRSKMLLASFAGSIMGMTIGKLAKLMGEQEKAERRLESAIGRRSSALLAFASAQQQVTTFGDEETITAMSLVGAYTDNEKAISRLTKASMDLAVAKGMDLNSAVDLVSKSVFSSTNALSRYGVTIEGSVGSVQRLESATSALASLYGGQAEANAQTFLGSMMQLGNSVGDLGEKFGSFFIPTITVSAKALKAFADSIDTEEIKAYGSAIVAVGGTYIVFTKGVALAKTAMMAFNKVTRKNLLMLAGMVAVGAIIDSFDIFKDSTEDLTGELEKLMGEIDDLNNKSKVSNDTMLRLALSQQALSDANAEEGAFERERNENITKMIHLRKELGITYGMTATQLKTALDKNIEGNIKYNEILTAQKNLQVKVREANLKTVSSGIGSLGALNKAMKGSAKVSKRLAQAQAIIDTYAGANRALRSGVPPWNFIAMASVIATGMANVATIEAQKFAKGGDFVTNKPELIMVGEAGREHVQITPVDRPEDRALGNGITVNIMGGIVQEDYVTNELLPAINKARALA